MGKSWRSCLLTINGQTRKLAYSDTAIRKLFLPLLTHLSDLYRQKGHRILVYLAAPAATGKTTLSYFLERLSLQMADGLVPVQRLGLEGFSRPAEELKRERDAEGKLLSPYGPLAFDTEALYEKIARLAAGEDVRFPVYDPSRGEIVPDITPIRKPIVIFEGCWLLYDRDGWERLRPYADYTVGITTHPESLAARIQKHLTGKGLTESEAERRYEEDYRPAIMQVLTGSIPADETWIYSEDGDYLPAPSRLEQQRRAQESQTDFDSVRRQDDPMLRAYEDQMATGGRSNTPFAVGYQQGIETARKNILRHLFESGSMNREGLMKTFHLSEEELQRLLY